jgi:hypothetical protein
MNWAWRPDGTSGRQRLGGSGVGRGRIQPAAGPAIYGGGRGTVRGFRYQGVGPQFCVKNYVPVPNQPCPTDGNPIGGTAIIAGSLEWRQRFAQNFGGAVFVDAGQVSASLKPLPSDFRVGVGMGVRYYTPIGPIRFDVAVPTGRKPIARTIRGGSATVTPGATIRTRLPARVRSASSRSVGTARSITPGHYADDPVLPRTAGSASEAFR